jgi:hypothetical protein
LRLITCQQIEVNMMFSPPDNSDMHPSALRLLECAKEASASTSAPITGFTDLIRRLNVTSGVMTNWKRRGVSSKGALQAEQEFGCSSSYVLLGTEPKWSQAPEGHPPLEGKVREKTPVYATTRLTRHEPIGTKLVSAPAVEWADLKVVLMKANREWPAEARVTFMSVAPSNVSECVKALVVEASKIPTIAPGDRIALDPSMPPWDDCVIVVQTMGGNTEIRRYRALANGDWEALAPNESPLDSSRHGLKLAGVVVGLNKLKF